MVTAPTSASIEAALTVRFMAALSCCCFGSSHEAPGPRGVAPVCAQPGCLTGDVDDEWYGTSFFANLSNASVI